MHPARTLPAIAAMLAAMAIFTANDTLMKQVAAELPAAQVIFLRGLFASLVLGLVVFATDARRRLSGLLDPRVNIRSAIEFVSIVCFVLALARQPIADVIALSQTAPLVLLLVASVVMRERIGVWRWALVGVGFLGALMVTQPGGAGFDPFLLFAFGSALVQAARDLISRDVRRDIPFTVVALSTVLVVAILAGLLCLVTETKPVAGWHWGYMAVSGALLAGAHACLFLAFRLGQASVVSPFGYSATLWAVLAGAIVFSDTPNGLALAGILVLTVSGVLLARANAPAPRALPD
jgi:drug/metabolite transporter (DMT)-like permease